MSLLLLGGVVGVASLALFYFDSVSFSKHLMIKEIALPQQRIPTGSHHPFPLIIEPKSKISLNEWTNWLSDHFQDVESLLYQHQAILFRNFPISNAYDFHDMVEATRLPSMDYIGGAAVRKQFTSRVVSSNESPPSEVIPFHHEMAQTPHPPTHSKNINSLMAPSLVNSLLLWRSGSRNRRGNSHLEFYRTLSTVTLGNSRFHTCN